MTRITVICQEEGYPDPLIYVVSVNNPTDLQEVEDAVTAERRRDLGEDVPCELHPLFAFAGDIETIADWRE